MLDSGRPRDELIEDWFDVERLRAAGDRRRRHAPAATSSTGPATATSTSACSGTSALGGRFLLQLRAEATNAFNIVNLSNPGTGLNAPATFGKIRSARDMRRIQLGARLSF